MTPAAPTLLVAREPQQGELLAALAGPDLEVVAVASATEAEARVAHAAAVVACVAAGDTAAADALAALRMDPGFRDVPLLLVLDDDDALGLVQSLSADEFVRINKIQVDLAQGSSVICAPTTAQELERKQRAPSSLSSSPHALSALDFRACSRACGHRPRGSKRPLSVVLTRRRARRRIGSRQRRPAALQTCGSTSRRPRDRAGPAHQEGMTSTVASHPVLDGVRDRLASLAALSLIPLAGRTGDRVLFLAPRGAQRPRKTSSEVHTSPRHGSALATHVSRARRDHQVRWVRRTGEERRSTAQVAARCARTRSS